MISLDVKSETTTSSSPLGFSSTEEEPTLSFSELLRGVSLKQDDKAVQNGALVLSLGKETKELKVDTQSDIKTSKNDILLALLKGDVKEPLLKETSKDELPLEINPQLTKELSVVELKTLVKDAKNYLKEKILASDDFKKHEIKELPKTLKGLAQMAKKFGLDVSKITIEEVRADAKLPVKPSVHHVTSQKEKTGDVPEVKSAKSESKDIDVDLPEVKTSKANNKEKVIDVAEVKTSKANNKEADTDVAEVKTSQAHNKEKATDVAEVKNTKIHTKEKTLQPVIAKRDDVKLQEQVKLDNPKVEIVTKTKATIKTTLLFKAQTALEHTTQQVIQTKQFTVEHKTPKEKADETLKLLISGEKVIKNDVTLTSDFSVASAKVTAPKATQELSSGLERLLMGDKPDTTESVKTDGLVTAKADSFEVKLNEAKQMIKYLSQDVKTAIEDYKSPFTRVKLQLNPQRLGEVDLTIVQRGKNLHINLSSNNTAINTLATNANDLKVQLANSGINNATLNFNNNPQGDNPQSQQQQQQRQNEQKANEEYNYFATEEENEEVLSSLEIIVPQYG
ncbi:MAG: flagellar hook-length control protein FliK [Sulfurimonas sp.]